jgi:hypothetical protein
VIICVIARRESEEKYRGLEAKLRDLEQSQRPPMPASLHNIPPQYPSQYPPNKQYQHQQYQPYPHPAQHHQQNQPNRQQPHHHEPRNHSQTLPGGSYHTDDSGREARGLYPAAAMTAPTAQHMHRNNPHQHQHQQPLLGHSNKPPQGGHDARQSRLVGELLDGGSDGEVEALVLSLDTLNTLPVRIPYNHLFVHPSIMCFVNIST